MYESKQTCKGMSFPRTEKQREKENKEVKNSLNQSAKFVIAISQWGSPSCEGVPS